MNELKDLSQIPDPPKEPARAFVDRRSRHHRYDQRQEKVINGVVKWKPIDKVAARVVAPASWHCQPPQQEPKFMKPMKPDDFGKETGRIRTTRGRVEEGHVEELLNRDDVEVIAVEKREKDTQKLVDNLQSLEARARDIHGSLDYLLANMEEPFVKSSELIGKHLALLREKRFAIDTESRLMMNQLKEVRQFFLDEKHDREVDRLREFVDLCERLKVLKESGFLDTIADTILKL